VEEDISCGFAASESVKDGMEKVNPKEVLDPSKCETSIAIGVFFDGTNNNRDESFVKRSHSNIARLSDAYPMDEAGRFARIYVPGVGTPFDKIADDGVSMKGGAFGVGCESRILYGLFSTFNAVHRSVFPGEDFFSENQVCAMCSSVKPDNPKVKAGLLRLHRLYGLLEEKKEIRKGFFKFQSGLLAKKIGSKGNVSVKEIYIDVFGFSRGAAQARVFSTWVSELFENGKFANISINFRFLGIFDTVVSYGVIEGISGGMVNYTAGHIGWAAAENLRIPKVVKNCVHLIAMHELRKNFPLDYLSRDGVLPSNYIELSYPGSHSDVGGGYAPGELGVSLGKTMAEGDSLKISQITLNHMFEYAKSAGVPLDKRLALDGTYDPFVMSPILVKAFKDFLKESGNSARPLRAWMQPYLNWRWQIRSSYEKSLHMVRANVADKALLKASNKKLLDDGKELLRCGDVKQAERHIKSVQGGKKTVYDPTYAQINIEIPQFDNEAVKVVHEANAAAPVSPSIISFFENFIHDSMAGFRKDLVEQSGYWRYRKAFRGGDMPVFAHNDQPQSDTV
jgi:hypothetical protein